MHEQGSERNCRAADDIRLAPDETWLCEHCYDDAAYECGEDANWPVWADLPKLSAALTAQPVAQEPVRWQRFNPQAEAWLEVSEDDLTHYRSKGQAIRPLYTHPATPAPVEAGPREARP